MTSTIKERSKTIKGLTIIQPESFFDHRGENIETYNENLYVELLKSTGMFEFDELKFVIDSFSESSKNVLRGFHGDKQNHKLIQVLHGDVYLVVIDVRPSSQTYKNKQYIQLNDKNRLQVLVPAGCVNAHLVMSEKCIFHYKLTKSYVNIDNQIHVKWNSSEHNVFWPSSSPILSHRDS